METRDGLGGMVDPLWQDVDEKTQPVPPMDGLEGDAAPQPGEREDINTGYPPVRQAGWDQVAEAQHEDDAREDTDPRGAQAGLA